MFRLLLFLVVPLLISALDWKSGSIPAVVSSPQKAEQRDSITQISLSFIGDLMCHSPQINNARKADGSYDFIPSFREIQGALSAADFTIGNLETTCAGSGRAYGGYPAFNTPDAYVAALKWAGIDILGTSNNHSMDTGEEGLLRTIKIIKENGISYTGTHLSQQDRDSIRVYEKNGIRFALLNYTYGTNGAYPASTRSYMLNVADSALVRKDVIRARQTNADVVVVFYHWGVENQAEPTAKQDSMFHWAADAGADLVIGSHPHVIGPVEKYKTTGGAKLDSGIVAWSLGNFLSNQYWRYTDAGLILNLKISKDLHTGKISLQRNSYVPTWVYRSYDPSMKEHVVLPAEWSAKDSLPSWINADSRTKMKQAFEDTELMMKKRNSGMVRDSLHP
ncbi:MAG: CapA family protein [Bacteroidia bacterium]